MFEITNILGGNAYQASHYFAGADDYYTKESPGQWHGKGAEALGLNGGVEQAQLSRLLQGHLPNGHKMPTTRTKDSERRMGIDCTISAPKSISMQALVGGDLRILKAHEKAVAQTMNEVEKLTLARKKTNGQTSYERTENLVIAACTHEMSRAKDPQLHTHAVIMNMTQRSDDKWRALVNDDFFLIKKEMDAYYKSVLAHEVQKLGYEIRLTDDQGNFELAHISREQIEAFSNRSKVIEEALEKKGLTRETATSVEKQIIALATRKKKDEKDRKTIKRYWLEKSKSLNINYQAHRSQNINLQMKNSAGTPAARPPASKNERNTLPESKQTINEQQEKPFKKESTQAIIKYAIKHLTEREAIISETALIKAALNRGIGIVSRDEIIVEINKQVQSGGLLVAEPTYKAFGPENLTEEHTIFGWKEYFKKLKGLSDKEAKLKVKKAIQGGYLMEAGRTYTTVIARKQERALLAIERDGRGKVKPNHP